MKTILTVLIASIMMISAVSIFVGDYEAESILTDGSILSERSAIDINGNSDFNSQNGVASGSGSFSDPYIIENFRFNTSGDNGIDIRNTDSHFIIRNCWISAGNDKRSEFTGLSLINVKNGSITNCKLDHNHNGIYGNDAYNIHIHNNTITENLNGVFLSLNCRNLTITDNECNLNAVGMVLEQDISDCYIANNTCFKNLLSGIALWDQCSGNIIENNTCSEAYLGYNPKKDMGGSGIYLTRSDNNTIKFNTCDKNTGYGISLYDSKSNKVNNNYLSNNRAHGEGFNRYGLNIQNSWGNVFKDNILTRCGINLYYDNPGSSFNFIDGSNKVNGKGIIYVKSDKTSKTYSGDIGPIILHNCGNKTIKGMEVVNIPSSIIVINSDNITVEKSSFSSFSSGIKIQYSKDVTISNNSIEHGYFWGISMEHTERSLIKNNRFDNIEGKGIESFYGSDGSPIIMDNNSFMDCGTGIGLVDSNYRISNNLFYSCRYAGISLQKSRGEIIGNKIVSNDVGISGGSCYDSVIEGNVIMGNDFGIDVSAQGKVLIRKNNITENERYGISVREYSSNGISIHHNSFYENNNGYVQGSDGSQLANWDDGISQGNYWSDYDDKYVPSASNDYVTWNMTYVVDDGSVPSSLNNITRKTRSGGVTNFGDDYPLVYPPVNISYTLALTTIQNKTAYVDHEYNVSARIIYSEEYSRLDRSADTNASWLRIIEFSDHHLIKGTPKAWDIGEYWVHLSATDGILEYHLNFTVTVGVRPLLITTSNVVTVDQGCQYCVDYDVGGDQEGLSWQLETYAGFLSLNNETGVLSGSPGWNDVGSFFVNISVKDGVHTVHTSFRLTVNDVNDPPQDLEILIVSTDLMEGGNQIVSASFFDPDIGDNASVSWYVDGELVCNEITFNLSLPDGNYTLTLRITDSKGIYSETSISIRVRENRSLGSDLDPKGINRAMIILLATLIIIIVIIPLLVVLRRRRPNEKGERVSEVQISPNSGRAVPFGRSFDTSLTPEPYLIKTGSIGEPPQSYEGEIPVEVDHVELEVLISQTLGPDHLPGTLDTSDILVRLKNKQKDGDLTKEEYRIIRKQIERIIEE